MKPTIKVVNLKEFNKQLEDLKGAGRGDALKRAGMAGGQVIEAAAKVNAEAQFRGSPTGTLKESIHTEIVEASENSVTVHIGSGLVYARIQEFGGWIKPVTAKVLSWINDKGERVFAKKAYIKARPYLRPARDENLQKVREAIGASIKASIEKALGKKG